MEKSKENSKDYEVVYVKCFRHWRTGKMVYASQYGKKAFRMLIRKS